MATKQDEGSDEKLSLLLRQLDGDVKSDEYGEKENKSCDDDDESREQLKHRRKRRKQLRVAGVGVSYVYWSCSVVFDFVVAMLWKRRRLLLICYCCWFYYFHCFSCCLCCLAQTKTSKTQLSKTIQTIATNNNTHYDHQTEARSPANAWLLPSRPSLFSIIRFPNDECFDSANQSGTCYTAFECKLLGGQPSSPCAAGFGSCCIVSRTCHVTTREKVVYFKNPSYPAADSDEKFCDLTIELSDFNVCQLRLDFLDFQLDPPLNGACQDDYMEISATGMPPQAIPKLCGQNRNQHRK